MKFKWCISKRNWDTGLALLREKTYLQKTYRSNVLIEKKDYLSNFSFYGVVDEHHFFISPVDMGINKIVIVLSGRKKDCTTGTEAIIEIAVAPFIKRVVFAVYAWFALGTFLAAFFSTQASEKYVTIIFSGAAILSFLFCLLLGRSLTKKKAQVQLDFLAKTFGMATSAETGR